MLYSFCLVVWILFGILFTPILKAEPLRYVAMGDSYTIGTGVEAKDNWPSRLAERLKASGIELVLTANLGRAGWTAKQALDREVPALKDLQPEFATLLIGVNDWIHNGSDRDFKRWLKKLMGGILEEVSHPNRFLVVTIPDFSCSPRGSTWGYGKSAVNGITRFNTIIQQEAAARKLKVVDIFELSRQACLQPDMFAEDGLHPSPEQYMLWVNLIFPAALELLKN